MSCVLSMYAGRRLANSKTDPRTPREERAHEEEGKRGRERQIDDDSHEQIYFGSRY